ncbi:beta-galactoside alpha-2,6-sialyltransferase 2 [Pectinophora gossypiella]|uniref:beta-galactoside alpha-2,6-sialyltransferase 2 n=1 Tax=Pectinophora gossypiella TaxID=13191 RepID=UPI00214F0540|nr:beta-galactoside alpha-2,6-sialyltransferase 2 [Pectinophora gossypiella]
MRAAAMSVWVFINLLCFGMCGYLYLIWSQYWMNIEKQRLFNKTPSTPQRSSLTSLNLEAKYNYPVYNASTLRIDSVRKRSAIGGFWSSGKVVQSPDKLSGSQHPSNNNIVRKSNGSPRFPNVHKPVLEFDSEKYLCDDLFTPECDARTEEFKELMLKEFHRVLMGESKVFRSGLDVHNTYDVKYEGSPRKEMSRLELLCALRAVRLRTVTSEDEPFKRLGFRIPGSPLQQHRAFNTCAVVTSAGALLGSRLGEFIDSHDMVLRFNNAPTENYTEDVGYKTTFRVLNSQVVTKPEFHFLEDPLYKDTSLLIWDPANYSSTLEEWYNHPDFPLFPVYKKLLQDRTDADVHLLSPQVLWGLWSVLQDSSPYRLRRNPPSSGFIGVWFSLHRCRRVRVFEYVPSARATRRCHYHSARDDAACTLGAWHPLAQEKALAERIRDNTDIDVFQRGFIDIPGFSSLSCP